MKKRYQVTIKSTNGESLTFFKEFFSAVLKKAAILHTFVNLPINKNRITLLKSPHVNKKSREQLEIKYLKVLFQINSPIGLNKLNKLLLNKPKVVSVNIKAV